VWKNYSSIMHFVNEKWATKTYLDLLLGQCFSFEDCIDCNYIMYNGCWLLMRLLSINWTQFQANISINIFAQYTDTLNDAPQLFLLSVTMKRSNNLFFSNSEIFCVQTNSLGTPQFLCIAQCIGWCAWCFCVCGFCESCSACRCGVSRGVD